MSLNRYNAASDANQPDIVKAMRDVGVRVDICGRPWDLVVTGPLGLLSRWAEVKDQHEAKSAYVGRPKRFTPKQKEVLKDWPGGKPAILVTLSHAIDFAAKLKSDERTLLYATKAKPATNLTEQAERISKSAQPVPDHNEPYEGGSNHG